VGTPDSQGTTGVGAQSGDVFGDQCLGEMEVVHASIVRC
jgi:hypothetical protein